MLARRCVGRTIRVVEGSAEVDEMPQRDRVHRLELAQLFGVRAVWRFAVGHREHRLPRARPDPEGRLEASIAPLTEHRGARESLLRDSIPTEADLVAGAKRLEPGKPRHLGGDPDRGELPAIAAELVDPERRHHLLDALAKRLDQIA